MTRHIADYEKRKNTHCCVTRWVWNETRKALNNGPCQEQEFLLQVSMQTSKFLRIFHLDVNFFICDTTARRMRWAGQVARMGEDRGVHRVLVGKPEGKRPLGRPRRRWEDNIKMDLQEVGGGRGDWMELAQHKERWRALVGTVRGFRVP